MESATTAGGETRDRILAIARRLFMQRGYEGTSMSALAEEVGISAPAFYWHFSSKEDLFIAVLRQSFETLLANLRTDDNRSPEERLRSFVRAYVIEQLLQGGSEPWRVRYGYEQLMSGVGPEHRDRFREYERAMLDRISEILRDGQRRGTFKISEVSVTALALITMCEYVFTWYRSGGPMSAEEVAEYYGELALRMVGAA